MLGKADLHVHTNFSDGMMSPADTMEFIADTTDLDVVAVTDHDTTEGALEAHRHARRHGLPIDVIVGQEVTTGDGDVLALFIEHSLPTFPTAAAAVEAIHHQGGLAVAAHPFTFGWDMASVHTAILRLPFDAVEARHGCPASLLANLVTTFLNRRGQRLPELGCSDSHVPFTAGQAFTWFPGRSDLELRQAIITGTARPGGTVWRPSALVRLALLVARHGWPHMPVKPTLSSYDG